jgi:hypothetical protein
MAFVGKSRKKETNGKKKMGYVGEQLLLLPNGFSRYLAAA